MLVIYIYHYIAIYPSISRETSRKLWWMNPNHLVGLLPMIHNATALQIVVNRSMSQLLRGPMV